MAKKTRRPSAFLTATARVHLIHDPEQNARIVIACQQPRAVHNRTVQHLLRHQSDEPLQKNTAKGVTELFGRWPAWRTENEGLSHIPSLVARGAISAAQDQVAKWEDTNLEHAVLVAQALRDGKPIPKRVDARQLVRSRKREERHGRHRCRIDENVRRTGTRTLHVPGIGTVITKDDIPADLDIRSCVILERTPKPRLKRKPRAEDRTFKVHVSGRLPKPRLKNPDEPGTACGIDHGVATAVTAADGNGNVLTFQHDLHEATRLQSRITRLQRRRSNCRTGSGRWTYYKTEENKLRRKLTDCRRHNRRSWANRLCRSHDTICVEKLNARNMTRAANGTNEAPGANVRQKSGLNRSLLGIAPREQTDILLRVGERTGTRVELVNAGGTSRQCNACGYTHPKNRKSQAFFKCGSCGHTANADANAARNVRDRGVAQIRARMDASRQAGDGRRPKEPMQAGRTRRAGATSRPLENPARPEGHRNRGRSRLQHANTDDQPDTGILAGLADTGILAERPDIVRFQPT